MTNVVAYHYGWNFPIFFRKIRGLLLFTNVKTNTWGMFLFYLGGKNASLSDKKRKILPQSQNLIWALNFIS